MEEEYPSFDLYFELLGPDFEQQNKTYQYQTEKEVEEFIKEQRNPKTVRKTELDCKKFWNSSKGNIPEKEA